MRETASARQTALVTSDTCTDRSGQGSFGGLSRARRHSNGQWYTYHKHSEQHNVLPRVQCKAVGLDFCTTQSTSSHSNGQYGTDISHKHSKQLNVLPRVGLDSK